MSLSRLAHAGHNMASRQSSGWSLEGGRGIRRDPSIFRHHVKTAGSCTQVSRPLKISTPGSPQGGQLGLMYQRSRKRCTGRVCSRRSDYGEISSLERLVRRTVKSQEKQERKEEGIIKEEQPKLVAITPKHTQLGSVVAAARGVLMTARVFTAMMTWVVLFFIASVWDGDSQSFKEPRNKNGKRDPRK